MTEATMYLVAVGGVGHDAASGFDVPGGSGGYNGGGGGGFFAGGGGGSGNPAGSGGGGSSLGDTVLLAGVEDAPSITIVHSVPTEPNTWTGSLCALTGSIEDLFAS